MIPDKQKRKWKWALSLSAIAIAGVGGLLYSAFQEVRLQSLEKSLLADRRFIASTISQYYHEHPEAKSPMTWEEFLPLCDAWYGNHNWVSWDPDATYTADISRDGGNIAITHPKLDAPIVFPY